jgi:hypothetical protein
VSSPGGRSSHERGGRRYGDRGRGVGGRLRQPEVRGCADYAGSKGRAGSAMGRQVPRLLSSGLRTPHKHSREGLSKTILVQTESYFVHHMGHITPPFAQCEIQVEYPRLVAGSFGHRTDRGQEIVSPQARKPVRIAELPGQKPSPQERPRWLDLRKDGGRIGLFERSQLPLAEDGR